ncbi:XkdQ/YqbQ family protein [Streptococcus sobrinus]|uniref:XkdQ/YqbQ family protein n=1 Tax=Streptococcus sobrinus TaxID=1310 RepID=UPI003F65E043
MESGLPVYISIPEIGLKKTYYVDTDRHEFQGTKHTMTIDVTEKNSLPEGTS